MLPRLLLLPVLLAAAACKPPPEWQKEVAGGKDASVRPPPATDSISLEQRQDGLFYEAGKDQPFTGTDVEVDRKKETEEQRMGFLVATPYVAGKVNGAKTVFYRGGGVQEERVYEQGVARHSTLYYPPGKGGGKKLEVTLNAKDVAEGRMVRYYPNGKVFTEAFMDENEEWHGEFREFAEDGTLLGHYLWEHGTLREIVHETPAQKEKRLKEKPDLKVAPKP